LGAGGRKFKSFRPILIMPTVFTQTVMESFAFSTGEPFGG